MTVVIEGTAGAVGETFRVQAQPGEWVVVEHSAADAALNAIAGLGPGSADITVNGRSLTALSAADRHRERLCVASCRLDPLPALRVADVVGLGLRAPQPPLWQAVIGTTRARALSADDEAQIRALAGRVGLARWVDRTAVDLPMKVEALTDLTRALAGLPLVLVWRRPEWLDPVSLAEVAEAVAAEQRLAGFAVIELMARPPDTLGPP